MTYFKEVIAIACVSDKMMEKMQYACEAFIKELVILKTQEDEKGNHHKYQWLNIVDTRGRVNHINGIIDGMFYIPFHTLYSPEKHDILEQILSDYFVPEDLPMVRRFVDTFYIYVYNYTQETCDNVNINHTSEAIFGRGMYFYMRMHHHVVINSLFRELDPTPNQLK